MRMFFTSYSSTPKEVYFVLKRPAEKSISYTLGPHIYTTEDRTRPHIYTTEDRTRVRPILRPSGTLWGLGSEILRGIKSSQIHDPKDKPSCFSLL